MYFFENFEIDHLIHLCTKNEKLLFNKINHGSLRFLHYRNFKKTLTKNLNNAKHVVTNGNIACRRHVVEKLKWSHTNIPHEDTFFNKAIYEGFSKCIIIPYTLIIYRMALSTWRKNKP